MSKKKILLTLLMFTMLFCGCSKISSKPASSVVRIAELLQKKEFGEAYSLYTNLTSIELDDLVKYIEKYPEKFPPIFYMILADHIYKTDKDKAVLWYYIGKLRAYEDVMMCNDETSRSQLAGYPLLAKDTINYMSSKVTDVNFSIDILQKSLDWDESHPKRTSPIWACYHGIEAFDHKPTLKQKSEFPKIKKEIRSQVETAINNRKNPEFVKQLKQYSKEYSVKN